MSFSDKRFTLNSPVVPNSFGTSLVRRSPNSMNSFAVSKCYEPPTASTLPKPPAAWFSSPSEKISYQVKQPHLAGFTNACHLKLLTYLAWARTTITNQLKSIPHWLQGLPKFNHDLKLRLL